MAFFGKIGKLLNHSAVRKINHGLSSVSQATRSTSSTKLFVEGLSYKIDETSLRNFFACYGEVLDAKIIKDRETGRSQGFGFVTFARRHLLPFRPSIFPCRPWKTRYYQFLWWFILLNSKIHQFTWWAWLKAWLSIWKIYSLCLVLIAILACFVSHRLRKNY